MDTILITGANRGIGLEFVRQYLEHGEKVLATARKLEQADELLELSESHSDRLSCFHLDVTEQESIDQLHQDLEDGGHEIDLLINNAGIMGSKESFESVTDLDILTVFDVNCLGPFRVTQKLLPSIQQNEGDVVFITSLMGSIEDNGMGGSYPYRISKASLNMLSRTLSRDYSDTDVRFLLLHPGWVKTRMGGENAKITKETSVSGMRDVIENLDDSMSGEFYNYDGNPLPW